MQRSALRSCSGGRAAGRQPFAARQETSLSSCLDKATQRHITGADAGTYSTPALHHTAAARTATGCTRLGASHVPGRHGEHVDCLPLALVAALGTQASRGAALAAAATPPGRHSVPEGALAAVLCKRMKRLAAAAVWRHADVHAPGPHSRTKMGCRSRKCNTPAPCAPVAFPVSTSSVSRSASLRRKRCMCLPEKELRATGTCVWCHDGVEKDIGGCCCAGRVQWAHGVCT